MKHHYDSQFQANAVKVLPGKYHVTSDPDEMLTTVLGSCVSACIRDSELCVGGMNHFLLPEGRESRVDADDATRYGYAAMEQLINAILSQGGRRERLEVKLFGGGHVARSSSTIGEKNIEFALDYLKREKLDVISRHLGGNQARRVHYFPASGKAFMRVVNRTADGGVLLDEEKYKRTLEVQSFGGAVELFD